MSNAALAFLAGMGQGYFRGEEQKDRKARQDRQDQREQETHDAAMSKVKREQESERALRDASKPVTVTEGANGMTLPESMDNRDVGLPENANLPNGGLQPGVRVGNQTFTDRAAADAAAASANTPKAIRTRQVAALQGIDPERALRLQAAGTQVEQAEQQAADQAWRRKVAGAMINGGHQGLAELVSGSEHGPMSGVKLQAVLSQDGKTVTYNKVDKDGKLTPTGLTFSNDGDGIARAAAALDGAITPADRVKMAQADAKERRESAKDESQMRLNTAHARLYEAAAGAQDAKATAGKPEKLDEDAKLRLTNANTRMRDAEKAVSEAMGKLMPGDDPAKSPAVSYAQGLLRQAKLDHLRTNIELGQLPASSMATQILSVAKSPQDVLKSLGEIASVGGTEYGDQVAALVQASDAWKQMNPEKKPAGKAAAAQGKAARGKPAAASGMPAPAARSSAAPAAPVTPADAIGQRVDQGREVLRRLQATAPGLAKGRAAIEEHAAAVQAAREELRTAEQAYQRAVEGQARPYFGGRPAAASGVSALSR